MSLSSICRLIVVVGGIAATGPLAAQSYQAPPPPTDAQKALLDKIQGVGALKFGAKMEAFEKDLVKVTEPNVEQLNPHGWQTFIDTKTGAITWGGLHPSKIEITFFDDQLIEISLQFNDELGNLLATDTAFVQKYGASEGSRSEGRDGGGS